MFSKFKGEGGGWGWGVGGGGEPFQMKQKYSVVFPKPQNLYTQDENHTSELRNSVLTIF